MESEGGALTSMELLDCSTAIFHRFSISKVDDLRGTVVYAQLGPTQTQKCAHLGRSER